MTTVETLCLALAEQFPEDAARVMEEFTARDGAELLVAIDPVVAAPVLAALSPSTAAAVGTALPTEAIALILAQLPPPTAAAFLRRVGEPGSAILTALPAKTAAAIQRLAKYPANTAGALMDPSVLTLATDVRASTALEVARANRERIPHYIYLTDRDGKLAGVVRPMDLAIADPTTSLAEVATRLVAKLRDHDDLVAVATHSGWHQWRSLPVVDREGRFLGAVRHRAVRQLLRAGQKAKPGSSLSLSLSLAELFWLGLTGMTEGLASSASRSASRDGH